MCFSCLSGNHLFIDSKPRITGFDGCEKITTIVTQGLQLIRTLKKQKTKQIGQPLVHGNARDHEDSMAVCDIGSSN